MRVTFETTDGFTEARLSENPDDLCWVAGLIERGFGGQWIKKLNGLDQSYWDYSLDGVMLTLHREHYMGVSIFPALAEGDVGRANELVLRIGAYFELLSDQAEV
jgi:hypothetical protein